MILDGLASQLFEDFYSSASTSEQKILQIIAQSKDRVITVSDVAKKMGKESKQITYIFNRLYEKDCLKKINRGKYMLFHGLFREYIKRAEWEMVSFFICSVQFLKNINCYKNINPIYLEL